MYNKANRGEKWNNIYLIQKQEERKNKGTKNRWDKQKKQQVGRIKPTISVIIQISALSTPIKKERYSGFFSLTHIFISSIF